MGTPFKDCEAGKFYGWTEDDHETFHPGDTVLLQWGSFPYHSPDGLNVSLTRVGGVLVGDILEGAYFSKGGSIYRTTEYPSSNCTLDQYNWTIPLNFNTTDPRYQFGLFNASTQRGMNGNELWGFIRWSAPFYVEASTTTTTTTGTATATASATNGNNSQAGTIATPTSSPSPTSSSSSTGLSGGAKAGIGVGVAVGVLALFGVFIFMFFRRRKAGGYRSPEEQVYRTAMDGTIEPKAPVADQEVHEMGGMSENSTAHQRFGMDGSMLSGPQELDGGPVHGYK